jgi:penicillin amidase
MANTGHDAVVVSNGDLDRPVRLITDRFGLCHIFAESERDVFFGQGFNVARQRLWQIDLWRRRGLGRLAEVLGPGFVAQDRASRMFLYPGDMETEWNSYPEGTRRICEDFCRGINAYVERVAAATLDPPREFRVLGYMPSRWHAHDIVRIRNNTLTTNAISELQRAELLQQDSAAADRLRCVLRPVRPDLKLEAKIESARELIVLMELVTSPVIITRERLDAGVADIEKWTDPRTFLASVEGFQQSPEALAIEGSNNWAIAGTRTATGSPILANDPHRALQNPSLRYAVHLHCPSFSVVGAGEPSLPGISIGHNGAVAFGLTIFPADQEDFFVFDIPKPDVSSPLTRHADSIQVRGHQPVEIEFFRFGGNPVLRLDLAAGHGIALRTVWTEPGASPYLGSLALLKAQSVAKFRSCLCTWRLPAVNFVAADRKGSVGWFVAGAVPKRKAGFGLVPRHSNDDPWAGFVPNEALPTSINPPCGYVMSANEFNLPASWNSSTLPVAFEWYENFRARRIHEVLRNQSAATIQDSLELQDDIVSPAARDVIELVKNCIDTKELTFRREFMAHFLTWNGAANNETSEAAFFSFWTTQFLKPAALSLIGEGTPKGIPVDISIEALIEELRAVDIRTRRHLLVESILAAERAFDKSKFVPRRALFRHAIQDNVVASLPFSVGPRVWSGDDTTVRFGKSGRDAGLIEFGASFRMVLDVADWDNSRWSNVPDQTVHASNSFGPVPLLYSPEAIGTNITSVIILNSQEKGH